MKNDPKKCVQTLMIGAIEAIEKHLGYMWGANKEECELTEEDDKNYEIFINLREEIMDIGNREICRIKGEKWTKKNSKF